MKTWINNMRLRKAEVEMLHIGLGNSFWHPYDILFILTGKVIG